MISSTAADSLRGTQFVAPPLDDPDDDGFYDHELEGLRVIHDGNDIGEVARELQEHVSREQSSGRRAPLSVLQRGIWFQSQVAAPGASASSLRSNVNAVCAT